MRRVSISLRINRRKPQPYSRWSRQEIQLLQKWYPVHGGRYVAQLLGRPFESVHQHAKRNGVKHTLRWTRQEDAILEKHYGTRSLYSIAKILGRKSHSVYSRVRRLKFPLLVHRWTESEKEFLRVNFRNMTAAEIAAKLGRPLSSVNNMRLVLGLRKYWRRK